MNHVEAENERRFLQSSAPTMGHWIIRSTPRGAEVELVTQDDYWDHSTTKWFTERYQHLFLGVDKPTGKLKITIY